VSILSSYSLVYYIHSIDIGYTIEMTLHVFPLAL
jgi:hypothetical protein